MIFQTSYFSSCQKDAFFQVIDVWWPVMFIFRVGQAELFESLVPKITVFPCQSLQTTLHFPLLSQAKQNTEVLNMQLIILKVLFGSDPPSAPVIRHPYSEEGRPEDRKNVHLFMICFIWSPDISNGKEIKLWVVKKSRYKCLCTFYSPLGLPCCISLSWCFQVLWKEFWIFFCLLFCWDW